MAIVDPATGRPFNNGAANVAPTTTESIIAALNLLNKRDEAMGQQLIHLGIFVEFVVQQLEKQTLVDLTGFEEFAQTKWEEIAKASGAKTVPQVNLNE